MFLTEADLISLRLRMEQGAQESAVLRDFIQQDAVSEQKRRMLEGERYYCAEHDILQKDFRQDFISETELDAVSGDEKEVIRQFKNPNRSNYHIVNAFHRMLVDQKVYYLVSREPTVRVNGAQGDPELQAYEKVLSEFTDEDFNALIQEVTINASNHGLGVVHPYYDGDGNLRFGVIPASEVIPIFDTRYERELVELVRYYTIMVVRNGKVVPRRRVEWWTKSDVTYFMEKEPDVFVRDSEVEVNPGPHWWEVLSSDGVERVRRPHSWGRVPFILLENNRYRKTDLEYVKGLIDAYDLLASDGVNNFADLVDLYWVIAGYGGETASAIARKLRVNRAVSVTDASGKIEAKQMELPVEGRIDFLRLLRRDIYHFGMGVDMSGDRLGSNVLTSSPSGVSLKYQYTQLDLKASGIAVRLKRMIKEILWYFTQDYNARFHTGFDAGLVYVNLNFNRIMNDAETVQMIRDSMGLVSKKTLLGYHPFVEDVNTELQEIREELASEAELDKSDKNGEEVESL